MKDIDTQELRELKRVGALDSPRTENLNREYERRVAAEQHDATLARELEAARNIRYQLEQAARPIERNLGHEPTSPEDVLVYGPDTNALVGTTTVQGRQCRVFLPRHSRIAFLSPAFAHELLASLPEYRGRDFRVSKPGADVRDLSALLRSIGFDETALDSGTVFATALEGLQSNEMARAWWASEMRARRTWRADVVRSAAMRWQLDDPFHREVA